MADQPYRLNFRGRGELDTTASVAEKAPGTLIVAKDMNPRTIGPKVGPQAFTRAWESPGVASLYDEITLTTGASTFGLGYGYEEQFRDLGLKWTLDLWFRLSSVAYAAGKDEIGLYKFQISGNPGIIDVSILGPNVAGHERINVEITIAGVGTVVMTGATRISVGTTQADKQHVRIVRDGANGYLYLNGVLDGSTTSLSPILAMTGALSSGAAVTLGAGFASPDPTVTLKGTFYGAVLRDGAFTTAPIEAVMPCNPHAKNVHHYYLGHNYALGGVDHFFDAGRFGAHARINGAGYTVTASNDDAAPAPAFVQGVRSWPTRSNKAASSVMCGGILTTAGVS